MSSQSDSNTELSPETAEILKDIIEETNRLRALDLGDVPPATILEGD